MKRLFTAIAVMAGAMAANAYTYPYFCFQKSNGTMVWMDVDNLSMSFAGGELVATDGSTTQTLAVADLSKMFFASDKSGIGEATADRQMPVEVYSTMGVSQGRFASADEARAALASGIYVMRRSDGITQKVIVR